MSHTPLDQLMRLMQRLRDPQTGCPWDKVQDFQSIAPYTIEEAYEVEDAIARGDMNGLREELGDLLFQVVFHAQMAHEQGAFDLEDIIIGLIEKMERRHPHIFGSETATDDVQVHRNWEQIKADERHQKNQTGLLDDIPMGLTAMTRALKLQKRAARIGFDWPEAPPILDKLHEEIAEFTHELNTDQPEPDRLEDELGDILFVIVNLARAYKIDPEAALRRTNRKFTSRFRFMEENSNDLSALSLEELDALWDLAKQAER